MNRVCEPTGMRVDRVLLFEGPREVEVIEECHCETRLSQCVRAPALRTYYSETPYETVVDVGGCSGSKGSPGVCGSNDVIIINMIISIIINNKSKKEEENHNNVTEF